MRENRTHERFCRHPAQGLVGETLTHDLFSRLTFVGFHVHVAGCLPCGLYPFFPRVKKLTRGAGVGHRVPPSSPATTWRRCLITFSWQLFVGRLLPPLSSPVCVAPSSRTSLLANSPRHP